MVLEDLTTELLSYHPNLQPGLNCSVTSERTDSYNCVAWAAHDTNRWWWPSEDPLDAFWPEQAERKPTLDAFEEAFVIIGFRPCEDADSEPGYEKVAIFATPDRVPQHAARQLADGRWTSKLGLLQDIEHQTLGNVTDNTYGTAQLFLRRPRVEQAQAE